MSEAASQKVILVTGPSGAGRSTAIHVLEDLGFEAIDNLPLSLIPRVLEGPPLVRPLALGLDARNRDFSAPAMLDLEYELLAAIRDQAEFLIDTSDLSPHDLRDQLQGWFSVPDNIKLALSITSFSYKRGVPRDADMVFDCRFLVNPHWQPELRALTGRDAAVAEYVAADPRFGDFMSQIETLTISLLPAFKQEGKSHLSICFGCTGGKHRSVSVTERMSKALATKGWQVSKRHRELERRVL